MSDHESLARAHQVIADAETGGYDEQLGIDPDTRALLTKATSDEPLTIADVQALTRLDRPDLIDAALRADRITLTEGTSE